MRPKSKILFVLFAISGLFAAFLIVKLVRFETGYCFVQNRYLSDQELVELTVADLLLKEAELKASLTPSLQTDYVFHKSTADFFGQNPNCCKSTVLDTWNRRPIKSDSRGYEVIVSQKRLISGESQFSWSSAFVSVCGDEIGYDPLHHASETKRTFKVDRSGS